MHERITVYDDHDRFCQQPLAILAVRLECTPVRKVTSWKPLIELASELVADIVPRPLFLGELGKPARTLFFGLFFGEGSELLPGDVTQVADEIHRLVIPDQHVHHAARRFRLTLQPHE